jgi:hypothetical protein
MSAVTSVCRAYGGMALQDNLLTATADILGTADAASLSTAGDPEIAFPIPENLGDDFGQESNWSICVPVGADAPKGPLQVDPRYTVVELPATTELSSVCPKDADAKSCIAALSDYMASRSYKAARYWRITADADGNRKITLAVTKTN